MSVRLWDADSGRHLLTVADYPAGVNRLAFSPDGRRLASGNVTSIVRIWETEAFPETVIRQRELVARIQDVFRRTGLREEVLSRFRPDHSLNDEERAFTFQVAGSCQESPALLQDLVWRAVQAPDRDHAVYQLALRPIRTAIRLAPQSDNRHRTTLGLALYRSGEYRQAMTTLEIESASDKETSSALNLFFLAICHARLGEPAKAKAYFDRAVKWVQGQKSLPAEHVEELKTFWIEAEEILR
jgi:WD40 repeat protein